MVTQDLRDVEATAEAIGERLGMPPLATLRWLLDELSRVPEVTEPERSLSTADRQALEAVGVRLVAPDTKAIAAQTLARFKARNAWLSAAEVADMLGVGQSMVRQRLGARQLVGEHDVRGAWRIAPWQFVDGQLVPHLTTLLPKIPTGVSAVAIERFLTEPSDDLMLSGVPVTPLQWLIAGESPQLVEAMVTVLGQTP